MQTLDEPNASGAEILLGISGLVVVFTAIGDHGVLRFKRFIKLIYLTETHGTDF
jgi:hypothetical protein